MVVPCADLARVTTPDLPPAGRGRRARASRGAVLSERVRRARAERRPPPDRQHLRSHRRHARRRGADPHGRRPHDAARADPDLPRLFRRRAADRRRAVRGRHRRRELAVPDRAGVRAAGRGVQPDRLGHRRTDGSAATVRSAASVRGGPTRTPVDRAAGDRRPAGVHGARRDGHRAARRLPGSTGRSSPCQVPASSSAWPPPC